jgi:hypothetical protein
MSDKSDSKTFDVSEVIRVRKRDDRITARINKDLKKLILEVLKAKGLSYCHINDALWIGWLRGYADKIGLDVKSPTIIQTVVRDVKRVRRYAKEVVGEKEVRADKCRFCNKAPIGNFVYKPTGKQYPLCEYHVGEFVTSHGSWRVVRDNDSKKSLKSEVEG